tara:strand:+ start:2214 stop:2678 length:465 start_codon:yes stop_codon:yes gene_type:complete
MSARINIHILIFLIISFFILNNCQFQEPSQNHGILFLENRSKKLVIKLSNKNDVLKIIGQPHSKSQNEEDQWIYIERIFTKGEYHKLGQNVLKENNVLLLSFDKYGVLIDKQFLDINDNKKVSFSEKTTENKLSQKSFVQNFLSSIRAKMYGKR